MIKPMIEIIRQTLMNLYNFPLLLPSSSLISDRETRFLIVASFALEAMVSHVMILKALWAFSKRTQVNCFLLTFADFFFSPVFVPFNSDVNPLGFSTVSTTASGAIKNPTWVKLLAVWGGLNVRSLIAWQRERRFRKEEKKNVNLGAQKLCLNGARKRNPNWQKQ